MKDEVNIPVGIPVDLKKTVDYTGGGVVSRTLIDKGIGNITIFSFDRGQGLSEHTSPYDAVVIVLDGTARVKIQDRDREVRSGEMLVMPAGIPHSLEAEEPFKMLLVMIRQKTGESGG